MEIKEKDIDLIERYLEGNLQDTEIQGFNDRLKSDQEFRMVLQEMETMVSGIKYTGRKNILSQLQQVEETLPQLRQEKEAKVVAMRRFRIWAAAASVLLVAVTAIWLLTPNQLDQSQLFTAYYQHSPNVELPTTRTANEISPRESAYQAYDSEQFQEAITRFQAIPDSQTKPIDSFYLALSYLSSGDALQAENLLRAYIPASQEIMKAKAQWYLAMALLSQGEIEETKELMQTIVSQESYNYKKASSLLEELK